MAIVVTYPTAAEVLAQSGALYAVPSTSDPASRVMQLYRQDAAGVTHVWKATSDTDSLARNDARFPTGSNAPKFVQEVAIV